MKPDQILIRSLRLPCHIGVPEEERAELQTLRAHLTMTVAPFPTDDSIEGTVDYKVVSDGVRKVALSDPRQLIETLAQDIANYVLENFPVEMVRVELEKFILPETDWVGVVIERKTAKRN